MVFVGATNPPAGDWPQRPYTVIEQTPVIREKPYLCVDDNGRYVLRVPELAPKPSKGVSWKSAASHEATIPIDRFLIARADRDDAARINAALDSGKNVLLTPGIYHL